jgi:hypothetical protein
MRAEMTPRDIASRFSRLIFAALESPATADKGELLVAASAFLDAAQAGDPNLLPIARSMASKAMDWCMFGTPECYRELKIAAQTFNLDIRIATAVDKMAH